MPQIHTGANISLEHELNFIESINKLIHDLPEEKKYTSKYKHIEVKKPIVITKEDLPVASKWKLDPQFIHGMMAHGEKEAEKFLAKFT